SLFLFVFCPNLNGHGILLTTDAYTALFTVSTAYYYWKFIKKSGWKYFLAFSISLGLAMIVKYSMLHLYIFLAIVSIFVLIKRKTIFTGFGRNLIRLAVLKIILLFIINLGFLFNHPGKSLDEFKMSSQAFTNLQNSFIGSIPLPLPEPYIVGLDQTIYMNELGAGNPNVSDANYLLGEKRTGTGFWYYYLVVFIFKTPLTALLILTGAIVFLFVRKKKQGHPSTMLFLLGMICYFLLVLGFQNNVQIGIRHALMVYPLLYVLAGFVVQLPFFQKRTKLFSSLIITYSLATYYYFFPNLISYSNELIPIKKDAYKVMADSNLDFGQGKYALEKYLKEHPDVQIITTQPGSGNFVIGVNDYLDLKGDHKYSRIYDVIPDGQINHCFLLVIIR
ncbi:MAG TPA: glycosyltransferase family 39 protein, partial [Chitinophagaceae bacterium]|nr:glycosyltransferase family 39 protein [Chitinophagaceae bacterium]